MTVKELIEKLQDVTNENYDVKIKDNYSNICDVYDVEEIDNTFIIRYFYNQY